MYDLRGDVRTLQMGSLAMCRGQGYEGGEEIETYDDIMKQYRTTLLEKIADELEIEYEKPPWRRDDA